MKFSKSIITFFSFFTIIVSGQVGVNTTTPDPSSVLDITSTTQGVLTPRMTTIQRIAISNPAEGLLVFDTDEDVFYFFDGGSWVPLEGAISRTNYKLVKSEADLPTPSGGVITLDEDTFYEINGMITLSNSIDINGAYIAGLDTNEDILLRVGGTIFSGSNGGSLRNLTLTAPGGSVFNLNNTSNDKILVLQDNIIANSNSVGLIKGYAVVFSNVIQYSGNTSGIVYEDIADLLLSNQGWFSNNGGAYETFSGTFDLIEKVSGFSIVNIGNYGIDVSSNPVVGTGVISSCVFSGPSNSYVNKYTGLPNPNYNFSNDWFINCPGLVLESDWVATGDVNLSAPVGSGFTTTFTGTGDSSRKKLEGTTSSNHLFRFSASGNNKIIYEGNKLRNFLITASLSFQGDNNNTVFVFYIAKNGTVLEETRVFREVGENDDVGALAIIGSIEMAPTDFIELWAERYSGAGNLSTVSLNLVAR
ncbi:hypothetical protein L3X37_13180 [Sabulilitoribacter arenilitoris]|uniref:Cell wall anchor protein n=1 Tax=Wocania arenilitoris TaxID=2044858 RepID=A0AAE3JLI3_9FLAO|nr:hypothetical protein [Wocania arenilitoris]MCF7569303.1 hypothetical protein [Wocania arenilitoris]